jgi:hypothetical protein
VRTYLLTGVLLCILALGLRAPIVFALGYVWAEILTPQNLAYSVINELPISMILAVLSAAFVPFVMVRTGFRWSFLMTLLLTYSLWMTATLAWAILPKEAWIRWDPAFKSVVFTFILTQYLSDRKKIEALVWTILLSGLAHTLARYPSAYGFNFVKGPGAKSRLGEFANTVRPPFIRPLVASIGRKLHSNNKLKDPEIAQGWPFWNSLDALAGEVGKELLTNCGGRSRLITLDGLLSRSSVKCTSF